MKLKVVVLVSIVLFCANLHANRKKIEHVYKAAKTHPKNTVAADILRKIIREYPHFPGMDKVYHLMHEKLWSIAELRNGVDYHQRKKLTKYIKKYPKEFGKMRSGSVWPTDIYLVKLVNYFPDSKFAESANYRILKSQHYNAGRKCKYMCAMYNVSWQMKHISQYPETKDFKTIIDEITKAMRSDFGDPKQALGDTNDERGIVDYLTKYEEYVGGASIEQRIMVYKTIAPYWEKILKYENANKLYRFIAVNTKDKDEALKYEAMKKDPKKIVIHLEKPIKFIDDKIVLYWSLKSDIKVDEFELYKQIPEDDGEYTLLTKLKGNVFSYVDVDNENSKVMYKILGKSKGSEVTSNEIAFPNSLKKWVRPKGVFIEEGKPYIYLHMNTLGFSQVWKIPLKGREVQKLNVMVALGPGVSSNLQLYDELWFVDDVNNRILKRKIKPKTFFEELFTIYSEDLLNEKYRQEYKRADPVDFYKKITDEIRSEFDSKFKNRGKILTYIFGRDLGEYEHRPSDFTKDGYKVNVGKELKELVLIKRMEEYVKDPQDGRLYWFYNSGRKVRISEAGLDILNADTNTGCNKNYIWMSPKTNKLMALCALENRLFYFNKDKLKFIKQKFSMKPMKGYQFERVYEDKTGESLLLLYRKGSSGTKRLVKYSLSDKEVWRRDTSSMELVHFDKKSQSFWLVNKTDKNSFQVRKIDANNKVIFDRTYSGE